ncbi:MAG: hypothetical protein QXF17_07030 [Ignisphaera sp.]
MGKGVEATKRLKPPPLIIPATVVAKAIAHSRSLPYPTPSNTSPESALLGTLISNAYCSFASIQYLLWRRNDPFVVLIFPDPNILLREHERAYKEALNKLRQLPPLTIRRTEQRGSSSSGATPISVEPISLYKVIEDRLFGEERCIGIVPPKPAVANTYKGYLISAKPDLVQINEFREVSKAIELKLIREEFIEYAKIQAQLYSYVYNCTTDLCIIQLAYHSSSSSSSRGEKNKGIASMHPPSSMPVDVINILRIANITSSMISNALPSLDTVMPFYQEYKEQTYGIP